MDVSIIIINYNTYKLTLDALKSIYHSETKYTYEIIVIDNHSSDNSVLEIKKKYPYVKIIENKENVGFARANNQAIQLTNGSYVFLLNSDTMIQNDTIEVLTDFMNKHPAVGVSGCKVNLPDGSLDKACKRGFPTPFASLSYMLKLDKLFPNSPKLNQYHLGHLDPNKDYPVDSLIGACMLVRKQAIDQVGLLDENFFMYGEDIDWCYRMKELDWIVYYYPYTSILHYKGASSRKKPVKIIYEFHRAMYLFYKKHFFHKYSILVAGFVYTGIGIKFSLSLLKNLLKPAR